MKPENPVATRISRESGATREALAKEPARKFLGGPEVADCVFLFLLEMLSTLPYLFGLGFYSDDWQYLATMVQSPDHGVVTLVRQMIQIDDHFLIRPLQLVFFVLGFKAFGQNPLPYHVVCSIMLALAVVFLYMALREMRLRRPLAFVIAMVFGLLPQYSTDRFWISSHQAAECVAWALLGIWALKRSVGPDSRRPAKLVALAVVALIFSILSYEVALGLILLSLGAIAWIALRETRASAKPQYTKVGILAGVGAVFLLAFFIKAHAQRTLVYHHHFFKRLGELTGHAAAQAVQFDFWTYCLHMPVVLISLYRSSALHVAACATAIFIGIAVTSYLSRFMQPFSIPGYRQCAWLVFAGFVLFASDFILFLSDVTEDFNTAGLANRVTITAAIGAACVLVALVSLFCSALKTEALRSRAFSVLIGLVCAVNSLAVSGIGFYWKDAAARQAAIIRSVAAHVSSLPPESALLLGGVCRYSGPAPVFEAPWDATGAMRMALQNDSLLSTVIAPNLAFKAASIEITIYGSTVNIPYGGHVYAYNLNHPALINLPSQQAATGYLSKMNPSGDSGCPAAQEGKGARIF